MTFKPIVPQNQPLINVLRIEPKLKEHDKKWLFHEKTDQVSYAVADYYNIESTIKPKPQTDLTSSQDRQACRADTTMNEQKYLILQFLYG